MKKIISLILALVMAMSLAVTAMAEDDVTTTGKAEGTVTIVDSSESNATDIKVPAKGSVTAFDKGKVDETYYVVMTWSVNSTLTYTVGAKDYKWNVYNVTGETETKLNGTSETKDPTEARYDVDGKWNGEATIKVDVTNWSNVDITATPAWVSGTKTTDGKNGVTKDIKITGLSDGVVGTTDIDRADKGVDASNYADFVAKADGENPAVKTASVFNKTIKTASTDAAGEVVLTDGAIKDTEDGFSAIIGTLTVTIAKKTTTPGA